MNPSRLKPVIVVTGASSGIGRATALAFARRGSSVVVAARRADRLDEVVQECVALGGKAIACPTDVTDPAQVAALGRAATEHFGGVDLWFNNAGVGAFGHFTDLPADVWRRVIDVNLFGYVNGARVALSIFNRQGHGVLVQNASVVGVTAKPDSTPYATSKFAVRGFSEALRQELLDQPDIHVCTILPAVIDTPFFQHAANYSGWKVRAAPPVYAPEDVAETVVELIDRPRAEVTIGGAAKFGALQRLLAPRFSTWLFGRAMHAGFLSAQPSGPTRGSLFQPIRDSARITGGWRSDDRSGVPKAAITAAILAPLGFALLRRMLRGERRS
jgi:NAD(P)-dependent dehydrogenase (short-subunit alcohol dehydrogenase family)